MIIVLGHARIAPEHLDAALADSRAHVARSLAEPGCLAHAVHRAVDDPATLVFVERWSDLAALQTHFRVPASREFGARLTAWSTEPPVLELFDASARPMPGGKSG